MNHHNSTLIVLILLTAVLVSGVFTANVPTAVFADSRILKQDTKQNADCDTVGANSPVSSSCNQRAANNISNGVPRTTGTSETTGILRIACGSVIRGLACPSPIQLTGNNPQPSSFSLQDGQTQAVILGPGSYTVHESPVGSPPPTFS